eukprot:733000-Rhodomonas_salina.3
MQCSAASCLPAARAGAARSRAAQSSGWRWWSVPGLFEGDRTSRSETLPAATGAGAPWRASAE